MSAAIPRRSVQVDGLLRTLRRVLTWLCLGVVPVAIVGATLILGFHRGHGAWGLDFDGNFVFPARDILNGVSPYHVPYLERVHSAVAAGHRPDEYSHGVFASYPPPALLLGVPFTWLPIGLAQWLWVGLMMACGALSLRIAGVRDWRVYGAALLTPAFGTSLAYGTVEGLLMLGLAATWRWRDQARRGGVALGALIALKLIFVPLLAWLVFTRRFASAAVACAFAAGICLLGWAVIGFHGLTSYPHLLGMLTDIEKLQGFSTVAYAHALGLGVGTASLAPYALGACLTALAWVALRRGGEQADAHCFALATLALMAFSPIVWIHYLTLLLVPLAVLRPRFGVAWLVPSLLWLVPFAGYSPSNPFKSFVVATATVATIVVAIGPRTFGAIVSESFRPRARAGTLRAWR